MKKIIFYLLTVILFFAGCKSLNNTQKGTAIGAAAGGTAGAFIGGKNSVLGALIGAAIGGGARLCNWSSYG
jgi:hypothetical protein